MLEQVLNFIHNFFVKEVYRGEFTISNGELQVDFLQENQYYKIVGSVFNDKVSKYSVEYLTDEVFTGEVWALAIPPTLIDLVIEIEDWQSKYGDAVMSPFSSESFDVYSYTKASGVSGVNGRSKPLMDWRDVFGAQLNQWRKIA